MSRAMRRHPATQAKAGRQAKAPPIKPSTRRPQQGRERSAGRLRPHFALDIISELRKVTWPSREDTQYLTIVVLVVAVAFGIFLGGIDMFFNWAIDRTLLAN